MKYLFFIIFIIISCLHISNKEHYENCYEKYTIPAVIHFNIGPGPINLIKLYLDIAETSREFEKNNISLSFIDIKYDSPYEINYNSPNTEYLHDREVIHIYFVSNVIQNKNPIIAGYHKRVSDKAFVVISDFSQPTTLAHEIGHFFGLDHVNNKDNIMDDQRQKTNPNLHFEDKQVNKIKIGMKYQKMIKLQCNE